MRSAVLCLAAAIGAGVIAALILSLLWYTGYVYGWTHHPYDAPVCLGAFIGGAIIGALEFLRDA